MATKLCLYLCFSVLGCIAILQCYVDCADPRQNVDRYFGPYKDIYPFVDITQDQLKCSIRENGTCPLYIGLMMSFGGEFDSSGVIPGVQLALDQINSDPTTLPGYTLHYTLRDTICETHGTVALNALHTELLQPPTKVGVIGSGCSLATEPTAQISHFYNITHRAFQNPCNMQGLPTKMTSYSRGTIIQKGRSTRAGIIHTVCTASLLLCCKDSSPGSDKLFWTLKFDNYFGVDTSSFSLISCASSSTSLANRIRFRYYFQLLATEADLAFGFYSIIAKFRWNRVAILLQEESLFEVTMSHLEQLLRTSDQSTEIEVARFSSAESIKGLGDQPFNPDYRIFVFAMFASHARRLLCEASQKGIHYPRNEFLFYGWYADQWWIGDEQEQKDLQSMYNNNCSAAQRERVIGPAMAPLQDEFISNCSRTIGSGINGIEFQKKYEDLFNQSAFSELNLREHAQSVYAQQCYDATWALARALNVTINEIDESPDLRESLKEFEANLDLPPDVEFGLQHFSYNNSGVIDLVFNHLTSTEFTGITGDVFFNMSTGVRIVPKTIIFQYRPTNVPECSSCSCSRTPQEFMTIGREVIAEVNIDDFSFNLLIDEDSLWTDGVPYAGVPVPVTVGVHLALTIICCLLAVAGIAFAIYCMIFNFQYRERKLIRLTSPNLNYLIGAGAIVLYVGVCFYVIPATNQIVATAFCHLTPWLTAIGYSLCYGTIVAKMFRVFYIFRNPSTKKRTVQDWMLTIAVGVFITIDIAILLVYTVVEGARGNLKAEQQPNDENIREEFGPTGIISEYFIYVCDSNSHDIALGILYGYKALLQIIALVFSFSIRKVKVKGLNDAKHIAAAVYVTSIVTAVIFVSLYSLKTYINLYAALFAFGFFIGTTFILILVFVPKMISLYRDPDGENVFSKTSPSLSHGSMQTNKDALKENERVIESLRNRVKELESSLQPDGKLDSSGDHEGDRTWSTSKVTFSNVSTLIYENDHGSTSVEGSLNNIVEGVQKYDSPTVVTH